MNEKNEKYKLNGARMLQTRKKKRKQKILKRVILRQIKLENKYKKNQFEIEKMINKSIHLEIQTHKNNLIKLKIHNFLKNNHNIFINMVKDSQ